MEADEKRRARFANKLRRQLLTGRLYETVFHIRVVWSVSLLSPGVLLDSV